jgi:hypothetical protein
MLIKFGRQWCEVDLLGRWSRCGDRRFDVCQVSGVFAMDSSSQVLPGIGLQVVEMIERSLTCRRFFCPFWAARGRPSVLDETGAKENPGEPGSVMHLLLLLKRREERLLFLSAEAEIFPRNIVPL